MTIAERRVLLALLKLHAAGATWVRGRALTRATQQLHQRARSAALRALERAELVERQTFQAHRGPAFPEFRVTDAGRSA